MRVELDVFSGRPNPSWHLCGAQAAALCDILEGLEQVAIEFPALPGLGYRGFRFGDAELENRALFGLVATPRGIFGDSRLSIEFSFLRSIPSEFADTAHVVEAMIDIQGRNAADL